MSLSLNNLAGLYYSQSDFDKAEPLFKRSLSIREKVLGPDHPDVAKILKNIAALYRATGRVSEADELEQRADKILEK